MNKGNQTSKVGVAWVATSNTTQVVHILTSGAKSTLFDINFVGIINRAPKDLGVRATSSLHRRHVLSKSNPQQKWNFFQPLLAVLYPSSIDQDWDQGEFAIFLWQCTYGAVVQIWSPLRNSCIIICKCRTTITCTFLCVCLKVIV